jgi:hypothetical protein
MKLYHLIAIIIFLASCSRNKVIPSKTYKNNFEEVSDFISGHFSNKSQSKTDTLFKNMELHIVPIYMNTDSIKWYYAERCLADSPKKPLEQIIYKLEVASNGIKLNFYDLPNKKPYVQAWKNPSMLNNNLSSSLRKKQGCAIFFNKKTKGVFTANTYGKNCRNLFMGSLYATTRILIDKDGMQLWERGYDEKDKLIWGPKRKGIMFEKIKNDE